MKITVIEWKQTEKKDWNVALDFNIEVYKVWCLNTCIIKN